MTRSVALIQLVLFSFTYAAFLRMATPSQTIQAWLHGVFLVAAIATYCIAQALRKGASQRYRWVRLLPCVIFAIAWGFGTITLTQYWSAQFAARSGTEAILFYGTSGTQFLNYQDVTFFGLLLIPAALITLVI